MLRSCLILLALTPATALGATLSVGPAGTYSTISDALNNANNGDVIEVEAGDYAETLVIDGLDIEIVGLGGSGSTSISGAAAENQVAIENGANVVLTGFELVGNSPRAINVFDSTLIGTDLLVTGFDITTFYAFDDGAGIQCDTGFIEIFDSTFDANIADDGPHLRLENCDAFVSNTSFMGGIADDDGGVARVDGSSLTLVDSWLEGNTAGGDGGAIYFTDTGSLSVSNSTLMGNASNGLGGAIRVGGTNGGQPVTVIIDSSTISDNQSFTSLGGAIYHRGDGDLTVANSTLSGNSSSGNGGAIRFFPDGTITGLIENNLFIGNTSGDIGGGMGAASQGFNGSTLEILGNDFRANDAGRGGGFSVESIADVVAIGNTVCGNTSYSSGGGMRLTNAGFAQALYSNNVVIENSTGGVGGGLAAFDTGGGYSPNHEFWNNTFTGNDAPDGGNVYVDNTGIDFVNNIFANATNGGGMYSSGGAPGRLDYNLWWNNSPDDPTGYLYAGDLGGNSVFADPLFANYSQDGVCGNDLLTLDPASPAIDAGDPAVQDNDGSTSDIGAYGGPNVPPGATVDNDGDGWPGIADCDDNDAAVNPDAQEVCDGIDNNCDGAVDDGQAPGATDWFPDRDADGYGEDAGMVSACDAPPGFIASGGDCNDGNDQINPAAAEICDGLDNDCNGTADDGLTETFYDDSDGDGFGDPGATTDTCDGAPAGTVTNADDCDDGNATIYPGAEEICDDLDNNCDGTADEGLVSTWYRDVDADGFGDDASSTEDCVQPSGFVVEGGDCDDSDPTINPGANDSTADGKDQNCDGKDGRKSASEDVVAISGCGCESTAGSTSSGWLALLGAAALLRRRRR